MDLEELRQLIERLRPNMSPAEYAKLCVALDTLNSVGCELDNKRASIQRLKQIIFGQATEKTDTICKNQDDTQEDAVEKNPPKPVKGHGRNGADSYVGAARTEVKHSELKAGDPCPACKKGTVYRHSKPTRIVRIRGFAPLQAEVYELEKLRCNLCGKLFTAPVPEGIGEDKYDAESASIIALLKYGSGMPFNRLERLQGNLGIPLPASTQWEIVHEASEAIDPVYRAMIGLAAQGKLLHHDDTTMKILKAVSQDSDRKGVFTTGVVSVLETGQRIALFFTGHKHAGENLIDLLQKRSDQLDKPLQMCDALSRNMPAGLQTIVGHCLAHGRRRFVEIVENVPNECLFVLSRLKEVYHCDDETQGMTDRDRLAYHQQHSAPKMAELHDWMNKQIDEHRVEPNSSLGQAIGYMLKHWEKLTLFLRQKGAPLDNNICERALKKAILNRKNAYFYKTLNGARVGDLYMGLIHTCELNQVNPFDYLTELQKNQPTIAADPEKWMPWNYRENLKTDSPA